jgi:hypothetical protein
MGVGAAATPRMKAIRPERMIRGTATCFICKVFVPGTKRVGPDTPRRTCAL